MNLPHYRHPFILGLVVIDQGLVRGDDMGQKCVVHFSLTKKFHEG